MVKLIQYIWTRQQNTELTELLAFAHHFHCVELLVQQERHACCDPSTVLENRSLNNKLIC